MSIWLDMLIFGNGKGLKAPNSSEKFYWLVDENSDNRSGAFYTLSFGFGAQLHSYQWLYPKINERRCFNGIEFKPFSATRRWGRVEISWAAVCPTSCPEEVYKVLNTIAETRYCGY